MPTPEPPAVWQVVALVLLAALPVLLGTRPVLRRLPEPSLTSEPSGPSEASGPSEPKTAYADLPTRRFVVGCAVLAAGAAALVALTLPVAVWPLWWVLAAPALVLVAVDARTTWLPLPLTRWVQGAAAGAGLLAGALGGLDLLLRATVGAAAAGLLYLLVWRLSGRTLGFGDVRLAPVIGAGAAAVGWSSLLAALLLGSLVGAAVGVLLVVRRRPGAFAYAPSMLLGAFGAAALRLVSG